MRASAEKALLITCCLFAATAVHQGKHTTVVNGQSPTSESRMRSCKSALSVARGDTWRSHTSATPSLSAPSRPARDLVGPLPVVLLVDDERRDLRLGDRTRWVVADCELLHQGTRRGHAQPHQMDAQVALSAARHTHKLANGYARTHARTHARAHAARPPARTHVQARVLELQST